MSATATSDWPDTDGLDQDDVEAGGLAEQHGLTGAAGDAAEVAAAGGGADERLGPVRQLGHAGLVAEDRSARAATRGVDGQHRQPVVLLDDVDAEGLDEGRLADAGRTGDADPGGATGVGQQRLEDLVGELAVVGPGGLGEGDRPGQRPAVTGPDALDELRRAIGSAAHASPRRSATSAITLRAAVGMLVPGAEDGGHPGLGEHVVVLGRDDAAADHDDVARRPPSSARR